MTASVLRFPPHPAPEPSELPDLPEQGPDRLARHRVTLYDALRWQHDALRDIYLVGDRPLRYAAPFARHPLLTFRRQDMARRMRLLRAALRDLER